MVEKPKRKWQNLFDQRCPNCGTKMESSGKYLACPFLKENEKNCFFISKEKAAEFLADPSHPAHFCLSDEKKLKIEEAIQKFK